MNKTIRLTESDIRRMVMEALEEVAGYKNTMQNAEEYFNPKTVKGNMRRIFNPKYKQYQRIQNNANKIGANATDTLNTQYDKMGDESFSYPRDVTEPAYQNYYKQQNPNASGDGSYWGEGHDLFKQNYATELGRQKKYGTGGRIAKPFGGEGEYLDNKRAEYNQQRQMIQNGQLEEAVTRAIRKYLK